MSYFFKIKIIIKNSILSNLLKELMPNKLLIELSTDLTIKLLTNFKKKY